VHGAAPPQGRATYDRACLVLGGSSIPARFSRYTAGSIIAFSCSELTLIICYGSGLLGAAAASVVAFFAGAIPNYILNRRWVWGRRGRVDVWRELVPYVGVSVAGLVIAALTTSLAASLAPGGHAASTVAVAIAYVVTYGVLFIVKFAIYHNVIFNERAPDETEMTRA
jgi:putative flippase GtrA